MVETVCELSPILRVTVVSSRPLESLTVRRSSITCSQQVFSSTPSIKVVVHAHTNMHTYTPHTYTSQKNGPSTNTAKPLLSKIWELLFSSIQLESLKAAYFKIFFSQGELWNEKKPACDLCKTDICQQQWQLYSDVITNMTKEVLEKKEEEDPQPAEASLWTVSSMSRK